MTSEKGRGRRGAFDSLNRRLHWVRDDTVIECRTVHTGNVEKKKKKNAPASVRVSAMINSDSGASDAINRAAKNQHKKGQRRKKRRSRDLVQPVRRSIARTVSLRRVCLSIVIVMSRDISQIAENIMSRLHFSSLRIRDTAVTVISIIKDSPAAALGFPGRGGGGVIDGQTAV